MNLWLAPLVIYRVSHFMQINDTINLAVCVDDTFASHLAVLLFSVGVHIASSRNLKVYIICDNSLSEINRGKISDTVKGFKFDIIFLSDTYNYNGLSIGKNFSKAGFFRINLTKILPAEVHKVLYLDADIVANGNIIEIYDREVKYILASRDPNIYMRKYFDILFGVKSEKGYFNSGVMLINVDSLRELNAADLIMKYMVEKKDFLHWHDQTGFNYVFHDKFEILEPKYNYIQCLISLKKIKQDIYSEEDYFEAKLNPVLVHFAGQPYKPWLFESIGPFKGIYKNYLRKTAYKDIVDNVTIRKICMKIKNTIIYIVLPTFLQKFLINVNGGIFLKEKIKRLKANNHLNAQK